MNIFKKIFSAADDAVRDMKRTPVMQRWMDEIREAEKREKDFRKEATRVTQLYDLNRPDDETGVEASFNILYANTEVLAPAVYNNTPRPVVKRKIDKQNPVAIAAAQVLQHSLVYLSDSGDRDYATFDDLMKISVQEALVPGRGLARFTYDPTIEEVPPTPEQLAADPAAKPSSRVTYETVCGDAVPWNRILFGYAKQWQNIPWQGFEHFMTREECIANFDEELGSKIKLTHTPSDDKETDKDRPADAQGVKFAHIYEIWDKRKKKVLFISEGYHDVIKETDDPLKLDGFFPNPRPIMFLQRISSLVPQTLYLMYEVQAKELEDITKRIGHLTRALKIRGFYDGTLQGLEDLLGKPENTLLPASNVAAMQQGMSLEKAIWFMPLDKLITVLQQLYINRTQVIGVIQQLTGLADIMRGASAASETLGAQKMKEAWGTLKLKRMQKEVQRFARDSLRIQAELVAKHFGIDTLKAMTGLQFPTAQEKAVAQQEMQVLQQQMQMQAQNAQPPMPGQPPQGPDPQMQQKMAQLQKTLTTPAWEDIQKLLRSDSIRNYVIDVETNSTLDIEATEDKAELAEMMNSMSQLMNGVFPMVEKGVLPFDAAKTLMLSVIGKFRLGEDVEATFRAMQQPQQKADPAAEKVKAELQRDEKKFAMEQQREESKLAGEKQLAELEMSVKREELELTREELRLKREFLLAKHNTDMQALVAKATMPQGGGNAAV